MGEPAYGVLQKYEHFMNRKRDPKFELRGGENGEDYNLTQYKMLFDAAAIGDTKTVLRLAKTININLGWSSQEDSVFGNSYNFTPLWVAARNGHTGTVMALVRHYKADPDIFDSKNRTPVWTAARNGHTGTVLALKKCEANCTAPDVDGLTPLYVAAAGGHLKTVKALLNDCNVHPFAALRKAAELDNTDVIKMLVEDCGVNPALVVGEGNAYRSTFPDSKAYNLLETLEKNKLNKKQPSRFQVNFPPKMQCLNEYCI